MLNHPLGGAAAQEAEAWQEKLRSAETLLLLPKQLLGSRAAQADTWAKKAGTVVRQDSFRTSREWVVICLDDKQIRSPHRNASVTHTLPPTPGSGRRERQGAVHPKCSH